jgi:pre-mRNA-splicing factor SPF27
MPSVIGADSAELVTNTNGADTNSDAEEEGGHGSVNVGTVSLPSSSTIGVTAAAGIAGFGGNALVDALPYIDSEYDEPGMREMVMALIEDEKKRYRPTKNYLEHMKPLELHRFETEMMKKEIERLSQRLPMETLSMKRYELPPPPTGKLTDIQAWSECVDNSYAQLEHQATRITNLEEMAEYGTEQWKLYLENVVRMVRVAQKEMKDVKRDIQEINWSRKSSQTNAGEQLKLLETSWVSLVSKNYEIAHACTGLEAEIYEKKAALAQKQFYQNAETAVPVQSSESSENMEVE